MSEDELKTRYPHKGQPGRFAVDHCHRTGKVRGLLCPPRNRLVGAADEKIPRLYNAIEYLESFYAAEAC